MTYRTLLALVLIACAALAACYRRSASPVTGPGAVATSAIRLNNLGVAQMNRGRASEALALFQKAWRLDDRLFAARLNEGIALLNTQRSEEARVVLLDATTREPESARSWYNLGILHRNLAEVEPAIAAFQRVAKLDPGDADALYFLGQLHAQTASFDQV